MLKVRELAIQLALPSISGSFQLFQVCWVSQEGWKEESNLWIPAPAPEQTKSPPVYGLCGPGCSLGLPIHLLSLACYPDFCFLNWLPHPSNTDFCHPGINVSHDDFCLISWNIPVFGVGYTPFLNSLVPPKSLECVSCHTQEARMVEWWIPKSHVLTLLPR